MFLVLYQVVIKLPNTGRNFLETPIGTEIKVLTAPGIDSFQGTYKTHTHTHIHAEIEFEVEDGYY